MDAAISPEAAMRNAGVTELAPLPPPAPAPIQADAEPPEYSDDAVALAFSNQHTGCLLFVPEWGHWLRWDGTRWARDTTLAVFDLVRIACREQAAHAEANTKGGGWVAKIASGQKVAAVEKMARADRR